MLVVYGVIALFRCIVLFVMYAIGSVYLICT